MISVKYFMPCADLDNDAFGSMGQYRKITGMVLKVDPEVGETITLQTNQTRQTISFDDIIEIENNTGVLDTVWELETP